MIRVYLNGKNINYYIDFETFPESVERSVRSGGISNYEAKSITFNVSKKISLVREDQVKIVDPENSKIYFQGFIDEILEKPGLFYEVTCFQNVLLLKDTKIGDKVDETEDGEEILEYDPGKNKNLREIIQDVLSSVNQAKKTGFYVTENSVPENPETGKKFFGNILKRVEINNIFYKILYLVLGAVNLTDGGLAFRKKGSQYYLIQANPGFFFKKYWDLGEWLNWTIQVPPFKIDLGVTTIKKGSWLKFHFRIPPFKLYFPTFGIRYDIYRLSAGGLSHVKEIEWSPLFPFYDPPPNLKDSYGSRITLTNSSNIKNSRISGYLKEEGWDKSSVSIKALFDLDSMNTYCIVKANKKYNDLFGSYLCLSFETPYDWVYSMVYRNASAWDILKDLALVTLRTIYIDENNLFYMVPIEESLGTYEIVRRNGLDWERKVSRDEARTISVSRYEEDSQGRVRSYGLKLRKNELDAIQAFYDEYMDRDRVENWLKAVENNPREGLLKSLVFDSEDLGQIIEEKIYFKEPLIEMRAEKYV